MRGPLWYIRKWSLDGLLDALLLQRASMLPLPHSQPHAPTLTRKGKGCKLTPSPAPHAALPPPRALPNVASIIKTMKTEVGVDASGFVLQLAAMACEDVEQDLRVEALAAMAILCDAREQDDVERTASGATDARRALQPWDGQTAWFEAALTCLEDGNALVREAALVVVEALASLATVGESFPD